MTFKPNPERDAAVLQAVESGQHPREIARQLGIGRSTVYGVLRRHNKDIRLGEPRSARRKKIINRAIGLGEHDINLARAEATKAGLSLSAYIRRLINDAAQRAEQPEGNTSDG